MPIHRRIRKCIACIWTALVLVIFLPGTSQAQINLASPEESQAVAPHASVYLQSTLDWETESRFDDKALPFEELVRLAEEGAFEPVTTRHIGFGLAMDVIHVRVPLVNLSDEPVERVLAFNRNFEGWYRAHLVVDGQPLPDAPILSFDFYGYEWPPISQLSANLDLPAEASGHLYLSFFNAELSIPLTVDTPDYYRAKRTAQDIHFFVVLGLLSGLTLITAGLMLTLRRFVALYYVGAVATGVLFVLLSEARLHGVLWFIPILVREGLHIYLLTLNLVFVLLFQRSFFDIEPERSQLLRRVSLFLVLWTIVFTMLIMFTDWVPLLFRLVSGIGSLAIILVNAVVAVVRGYVGRWPFFLGSTVFLLSLTFKLLAFQFSWLITDREASLIFLHAIAFEAAMLALAMILQIGAMRRQREDALQAQSDLAREKLELAQSMAHAAHDIRQPLTSLRISLADQATNGRQATEIEGAIDYLDGLVQSQLGGQTAAAAQGDGEMEPFAMNIVLSNVVAMFRDEAEAKGLDLRVMPSSVVVRSNIFSVMRVLSNLVANAIRNTEAGRVLVGVRRVGSTVRVEIHDTGSGMSADAASAYEAEGERGGDYEGNGMGLNIVRGISEELGLDLATRGSVGRGTTVTFRLPRA